ncbi:MAG: hypothetical protein J5759_04260 [Bacteroidales bacterium]|nr:hypothetical protein [Bacteroidales bacterium]
MKAIKILSTLAIAALALVGCQKEAKEFAPAPTSNELSSLIKIGEPLTITATKGVDTKTVMDGTDILWLPGDQITLVYGNADNYATGVFTANITDPAKTAEFTGTLNMVLGKAEDLGGGSTDAEDYLYGVFPASDKVGMTKNYDNTIDLLVVPFKAEQTAVDGSFDKTAFTSCGRSSNLNIKFYNVNSVLALKVEEDGVNQILVENVDMSLGGIGTTIQKMRFYADDDMLEWGSSGITHQVSLLPPEGEETFTKGNTYYMVVVADTYKDGVIFTMHTAGGDLTMPITSSVTAERSKIHNVTLKTASEPVLTVERVWGKYPIDLGKAWTKEYDGFANYIIGNDRTMAADDQFVYVAAASASTSGILGISLTDPDVLQEVNMTGVEGGFFATACVRTIFNPTTGKYILLAGSLAYDSDCTFNVYAWLNGIDESPAKIISWNSSNRRVGDFFNVVGDWSNGEIWARLNNAGSASPSFKWSISNGNISGPLGGQMGYAGAAGMGQIYKYNVGAKQALLVTPTIGRFFNYDDSDGWLNVNNAGVDWAGIDNSVMARKFGITPFEFNGKKYIAYVKKGMYNNDGNAARARIKIIEDKGSADLFLSSMEADNVLWEFPIQNGNNATTEAEFNEVYYVDNPSTAGQEMANCSVVPGTDCVYLVGHLYNVGVSVFKMYMK